MNYRDFFKNLTGFYPHPYQEQLAERLLAGDSLIVRVPTGAGKTWAAVAPFLYSLAVGRPIADRLLYALPLRSLASSLHASVHHRMVSVFGKVSAIGNNREYSSDQRYCSLQMGGQKDDAFFESDVVLTTIDQLLSSYVFLPVSLPDRVGNINAGALIGSLVVFDEVHLLDASVALGTVVEMLDRLRGICQFVLMTATMSDTAVDLLGRHLRVEPLPIDDDQVRELPSQRTKRRTWRWSSEPIDGRRIKAQYCRDRTIVLVNSVRRAQELLVELERLYAQESEKPELILLHARFYPEDRKTIEDVLPDYFGPNATKTNIILITNQVIEAGLDLSADHLHTELAPMNALVQRAGRTARYEDRCTGTITVYEVAGLGPYKEDRHLVEATRVVLQALPAEGRVVDFTEEQRWVQVVHSNTDEQELKQYNNLFSRRKAVHEAMDQGNRGKLSQLVRDIDSVGVIIAEHPERLFMRRLWPRLLGVPGVSLMRLRQHFKNLEPGKWVAKGAAEASDDERPGSSLAWQVLSANELRTQWLVAIHPDFASYDRRLGLRLGHGGPQPQVLFNEAPLAQRYDYGFEPWVTHSERILDRARAMRGSYTRSAESLSRRVGASAELIESLVEITCMFHDTGKLTLDWQQRAWRWQDDKDARARAAGVMVPARPRVPIAHTWFESDADRDFRRQSQYKFPPHAVQGAFAVCDVVAAKLAQIGGLDWGELATVCSITAIARHHGTHTRECTLFRFSPEMAQTVTKALPGEWPNFLMQECLDPVDKDSFSDQLLRFSDGTDERSWLLYAFLIRRLRLADQSALR
jgi:CRISPR-associated endonuclease/helicase Cas3